MGSPTYQELVKCFVTYLRVKWKWLGLPPLTPLQEEIAEFISTGGDRKMLKAFRGIGKTWITGSQCEHKWLNDRDRRILLVSGNQRKADEISLFIRTCIDNFPVLEPLRWAEWEKQHVRWGIQQFNIKGAPPDVAPSLKAASIGSMLTGSRAHDIIGDDIETPINSATVELRDHLLGQIGEFESILLPGGTIDLLGTPQSDESIYTVMEDRGYNSLVIPARVPKEDEIHIYRAGLSPRVQDMVNKGLVDQPTEPTRFPEEVLLQKEAGMTKSAWRLQMMLDTSLADADRHPLKLNDLIVSPLDRTMAPMLVVWNGGEKHRAPLQSPGFTGDYLVNPMHIGEDWRPYDTKVLFVDPSGRGDNETSWCVMGTLAGRLFLLDWGGTLDGYSEETQNMLGKKCIEHQVNEVVYEDNYGDGMFGTILGAHLKVVYPVRLTPVRNSGQKERRIIETIEPVLRSHKLVIDQGTALSDIQSEPSGYGLLHQLTRITYDRGSLRWDDRLDCLSLGVSHLQRSAGINSDEALSHLQRASREAAIESLLNTSLVFETEEIKLNRGLQELSRRKPGKLLWNKQPKIGETNSGKTKNRQ